MTNCLCCSKLRIHTEATAINPTLTLGPLTARLRADASWTGYPERQEWADECESLLQFAQGHGVLDRFWPRLRAKSTRHDEMLNELRVAQFLESSGFPVVDWEPKDAGDCTVECSIATGEGQDAFVEVKSPGWESELRGEERIARKQLPKHIDGEGRAADPIGLIRRTVIKALPKFSGRAPSILFIADDCFVNVGEWGWGPMQMALLQRSFAWGDGLFHKREYATLGAVCLFWAKADLGKAGVEYNVICALNPNAMPSAKIPARLYEALHQKPQYAGA